MKKFKDKDIEVFARDYVETALMVVNGGCSMEEFDARVRFVVGYNHNMTEKQVTQVHHCFHKAFFLENSGKSLLRLIEPEKPNDVLRVGKARKYCNHNIRRLTNSVLENMFYLRTRFNNLYQES